MNRARRMTDQDLIVSTYFDLEDAVKARKETLAIKIFSDPRFDRDCRHPGSGCNALHLAASANMCKLATACLTSISVDVLDTKAGFTPLHFACMNTNKKMVKLLLSYGADTTIKSNSSSGIKLYENRSPLEILIHLGKNTAHKNSIRKLLIVDVADRSIEGSSKTCRGCGIKEGGRDLVKLSHCKCGLWFCGKKCQKKAWKTGHKEECKKLCKEKSLVKKNEGVSLVRGAAGGGLQFKYDEAKMKSTLSPGERRPHSFAEMGISKADQRFFVTMCDEKTGEKTMTPGQIKIAVFGSQERYMKQRKEWEERALAATAPDLMQHYFRSHIEKGNKVEIFWNMIDAGM